MTKEEQNQIIKDAMVRNLRKEVSIPEDIGKTFNYWVKNKINMAMGQLQQQQPADSQEQQAGGEQQ